MPSEKLIIFAPSVCRNEVEWVLNQIFYYFLGIEYDLIFHEKESFILKNISRDKEILIDSPLFSFLNNNWLDNKSALPYSDSMTVDTSFLKDQSNLMYKNIPVIFGDNKVIIKINSINLGVDIFGSIFFLLSRYEESLNFKKDTHDRFCAESSWAGQNNYLHRPLVNEYMVFLLACLEDIGISVSPKKRHFKNIITADVDIPYSSALKSPVAYIRQVLGDIVKRRNIKLAIKDLVNPFFFIFGVTRFDPFYKYFDWMMGVNEELGNPITFYIMINTGVSKFDGLYDINEPIIRKLIKSIDKRGHRLGIHFSYDSCRNKDLMGKELSKFKKVLSEENINIDKIFARQHFLRWDNSITASLQDQLGVFQDSTLTFHNHIGFRSGVCFDYQMYDVLNRRKLDLVQCPLIAMEASIFETKYMNMKPNKESLDLVLSYKETCMFYNGSFNLLWHNNRFIGHGYEDFYKKLLN